MTNTSRNGIGAKRSRAISVSHWAHALGLPLPTRKFFKLRFFHGGNLLPCHAALQQHEQFLVESVEVGHQQADSSFPIIACHYRFKANPGGQTHRGSDSITARNNIRVCELQRLGAGTVASASNSVCACPSTLRSLLQRDVQGSLQHVKLVICRLPVTQAIFSSMDKTVVAFIRFCSGNECR